MEIGGASSRRAARIGWYVVAVLAVLVGLASLRFLSFRPEMAGEEIRGNLIDHPLAFYTHTIVASVALLIGVWQFLPRTRRGRYHRWAGRAYVGAVAIGAITGLIVAPTTEAGPVAGTAFVILAILWFLATALAFVAARNRDFAAHRIWMIRSYALTSAAITLRIILPVGIVSGLDFYAAYTIAAWGSWTVNLVIAEIIVRRVKQGARPVFAPARAAT